MLSYNFCQAGSLFLYILQNKSAQKQTYEQQSIKFFFFSFYKKHAVLT